MAIIISKRGRDASIIEKTNFAKEHNLQEYIHEHPEAIPVYEIEKEKRLFVAAREFLTKSGPIDALAVDKDGDIYIVETKLFANADKRRVVAQALDYGASLWKHLNDVEQLISLLDQHVKSKWNVDFRQKFQNFFNLNEDELEDIVRVMGENLREGNLKFVVLMNSMDERLRDLITYVNQKSQFDIYAVELEFYKHEQFEILLPKLYGVEVKKDVAKNAAGGLFTEASLMQLAQQRNVTQLTEICRQMKSVWEEQYERTGGGSFRYWVPQKAKGRMVYGVNVSGQLANAPDGEIDVWLRPDAIAEVMGLPEASITSRFSKSFKPFSAGRMDFVVRLKTVEDANSFVTQLRRLANEQAKAMKAGASA